MKLNISPKTKNILWIVFAVAIVAVCLVMFILNPGPEHIEDTNGKDNYNLQTITEQDVVKQEMGARGTVRERETHLDIAGWSVSEGIRYSSDKFTGVSMLHNTTLMKGSDIHVTLAEYEIKEGNFAFYIVFDGEVVGKITPGDGAYSEFLLENVEKTGTLEYVIAGESASFEFVAPTDFES
ncbi:MAG: hypothetical protein IJZ68_12635 [Bacteroidaceae bacterium]|nr:hypothetical protein [Bacteroidaceae bacterium]